MEKKKTIFFDLGNVLLFFSHEKMYDQLARFCGTSVDRMKQVFKEDSLADHYETGKVDSRMLHTTLSSRLQKPLDYEGLMHRLSDIFHPNEAMYPLLHQLKKENVELILLSNTCDAHFEYALKHYDFLKLFDRFVLSYQVQAQKPDPSIYHYALSQTDSSIENCFYTDDIEEYVLSARNLGIDAEVFKDVDTLTKHLVMREFIT